MNTQRAAEIQVVLEGIRLPATRDELIAYARTWDATAAAELAMLPDRPFGRIDEVGEALLHQRRHSATDPRTPGTESGLPPGGDSCVDGRPQIGAIASRRRPTRLKRRTTARPGH